MRKCGLRCYVIDAELGSGEVSEPVSLGRWAGVGVRRQRCYRDASLVPVTPPVLVAGAQQSCVRTIHTT